MFLHCTAQGVVPEVRISASFDVLAGEVDATARAQLRARIPKTKPAFERLIVDDSSKLWVLRTKVPDEGVGPGRPIDVFDAAGVYLGTLAVDLQSFPPPRVMRDRIVGVTRDDLDVPYVVVYRIN